MTFGILPYGTSAYGGASTTIAIRRAWAVATHVVRVETSAPAAAVDPFADGDALNPSTWTVMRLDAMVALTPIFVTRAGSTAFEVRLLEALGSHMVTHRVSSSSLRSVGGTVLLTAPYAFDFPGLVRTIDPVSAARRRPIVRDLRNPFRIDRASGSVVSAVMVDASADYATEEDIEVARKGILRRLTTPRGAIRSLPNYGIGVRSKDLVPLGGDETALVADVERQVMQEPGIKRVRAGVEVLGGDMIRLRVRARMTGAQLELSVKRSIDGNFVEL